MKDRCDLIQRSFADRQDADSEKPNLACLTPEMTVGQKAKDLRCLRDGIKSGCIATQALATGMDYSYRSVIMSHLAPGYLLKWDAYTHASGRCGRKVGELGMCVIFIETPVRFPVFCSPGVFFNNLSTSP
jgi:superfamily II DNA/RNA helicase